MLADNIVEGSLTDFVAHVKVQEKGARVLLASSRFEPGTLPGAS